MMLMRNASGLTRSESRFRNERVKIAGRRSKWVAIGIMNGWWQRIGNKEQATTVILGRVVRRGVKRRHAHPLLSRLEKDYLNSPPYRSSPNLYEPHSALVSGVSLSNLPPPFPLISLSLSLYLSLSFFLSFFLFILLFFGVSLCASKNGIWLLTAQPAVSLIFWIVRLFVCFSFESPFFCLEIKNSSQQLVNGSEYQLRNALLT